MEVVGALILIGFLLFIYSGQDKSTTKLKNDADLKKWKEESISGKTELELDAWKNLQTQNKLNQRAQAQKKLYEKLVELGIQHKNAIRHGTFRKYNDEFIDYFTDSPKSIGIHPEEVSLRERKETAEELVNRVWQKDTRARALEHSGLISLDNRNGVKPPASKDARLAATEELKKIDHEWSLLNNRLLDEYYLNEVKDINPNDFIFTYHPPKDDARFPYSAGGWHATSKIWGVNQFKKIEPLHGYGTAKNQALFEAVKRIQIRKHQNVRLPFDPWNADL